MSLVNTFIQQQDDQDFVGTWMMIANFDETPQDGSTDNRVRKLHSSILFINNNYEYDYI